MLYRSEITNLPGQQNCAKIQRNHEKFEQPPNKNLHYIQFQHNSIEAYPEVPKSIYNTIFFFNFYLTLF